ncbi:hypothetical protein [Povalibacter sp.]|uniref:hypothetical protein n=1 Tax=Povalibacter sp. TaxID=1962978 RepID=UPI002F3F53EE
MSRTKRLLLAVEVAVCFLPLAFPLLWMLAVVVMTPIFMVLSGHEAQSSSQGWLALFGAALGILALVSMLSFVFGGRRLLSRGKMAALYSVGLLTLTLGWIDDGSFDREAILYFVLPLFCGLHLLYLGRSYFHVANKTMEPTR